ncbi:MAG: hypothetical protein SPI34_08735 [Opitutales bacterium]|nr:hypothetical protein [Opitutales bacterium]
MFCLKSNNEKRCFSRCLKIGAAYIKRLHDEGFIVGFWQAEDLDELAYAAKMGADRVCSNHAYRLR